MARPAAAPHNPQSIEIFSTGMTTDLRKIIRVNRRIMRPFQSLQHFDVYPDRLVPKRDWVLDGLATAANLTRFEFFDAVGSGYTLWGLGHDGSNHALLLAKDPLNPLSGTWYTYANTVTASTVGSLQNPWLFGYKGWLYFMTSGGLCRYQPSSGTMTEGWQAIGAAHTCKPVVHPRTGAAYFAFDNSVYQISPDGTWLGVVQTIPSDKYVTSLAPHGNNLAIGAAPVNTYGRSTVYLFDLSVTSSPTSLNFSETIDWGAGTLMHLASCYGYLIGVSNEQIDNQISINRGRMVSRVYTSTVAEEVSYITADQVSAVPISASSFTDGDKLFFPASIPFMGDQRNAVWSVDRGGTFTMEAVEPTITSSQRLTSCYRLGKAWFVARSDGNVYRTNDQASYTAPSVLETTLYGDRFNAAEFFGATVSFEPLASWQSVTLKYRPAGTTAWTQLGATVSALGITQLQALGNSAHVPPRLGEYQFRIESRGAVITGLSWMSDGFDANIYG